MNTEDLQQLRQDYSRHSLSKSDVCPDPLDQFRKWMEEALKARVPEPNAMTLATVDAANKPHSRVVLLKGIDDTGFVFYTNHSSAKGKEIEQNPNVSLCFFWIELERQVRIDGTAHKLPREKSEAYFKKRPYKSQIGALASNQSEIVPDRKYLEDKFEELQHKYREGEVPMPDNWGGYCVIPEAIEFWQGRRNRLHDRIKFDKENNGNWSIKRLSP